MKRSIEIKNKEERLINRLNSNLKAHNDNSTDASNEVENIRWDNHGPVQFEGQDTETTIVKEEPVPAESAEGTRLRPHYEEINHPLHYNNYDVEVIDMMERIFGVEATAIFCKLNAFKYRMRAGTKPNQSAEKDLKKEQWYINKCLELRDKLTQ